MILLKILAVFRHSAIMHLGNLETSNFWFFEMYFFVVWFLTQYIRIVGSKIVEISVLCKQWNLQVRKECIKIVCRRRNNEVVGYVIVTELFFEKSVCRSLSSTFVEKKKLDNSLQLEVLSGLRLKDSWTIVLLLFPDRTKRSIKEKKNTKGMYML